MLFDDLPLLTKILIAVVCPPMVTSICWLAGPLLAGSGRERSRTRNWVEFWSMLLASYLIFAVAFGGILSFHGNDHADPSSQLVRSTLLLMTWSAGFTRLQLIAAPHED
jgi:hypothetical protein